jgi:hypothetical protein
MKITTWQRFAREVRSRGNLLRELHRFPNAVLVSGCQRSGGTMLAHAITRHPEIVDIDWFRDAELHAALILAGVEDVPDATGPQRGAAQPDRWCFQTTYLNECYPEYIAQPQPFKLIWLVRNPYSVVYSMVANWKRFALNELFDACGAEHLTGVHRERYERWGRFGVRLVTRACAAYVGKVEQMVELKARLPEGSMAIVEYEELVQDRETVLAGLCLFADLGPDSAIAATINTHSLDKASRLSRDERRLTAELCGAAYDRARALARSRG